MLPHRKLLPLTLILLIWSLNACLKPAALVNEPNSAFKHYSKAAQLFNQSKLDSALIAINKAIAINPRLADNFVLKGDILSAIQKPNLALAIYEKAIKIRSHFPNLHKKMGDLNFKLKQYDAAINNYKKLRAHMPENFESYLLLAKCYLQKEERIVCSNMLENYKREQEKRVAPFLPLYYILRAKLAYENQQYKKVDQFYNALNPALLNQRNHIAFYIRSQFLLGLDERAYMLATSKFKERITETDFLFFRGLYYFKKKKYNDAAIQLAQAAEMGHEIFETYTLLQQINTLVSSPHLTKPKTNGMVLKWINLGL